MRSSLYCSYDDRYGGVDAHAECSDASDHHAQYDAEGSSTSGCVPRRKSQSYHSSHSLTFRAGNHQGILCSTYIKLICVHFSM